MGGGGGGGGIDPYFKEQMDRINAITPSAWVQQFPGMSTGVQQGLDYRAGLENDLLDQAGFGQPQMPESIGLRHEAIQNGMQQQEPPPEQEQPWQRNFEEKRRATLSGAIPWQAGSGVRPLGNGG